MKQVVEWCDNFKEDGKVPHIIEPPLCHSDLKMVIDEWSANWINAIGDDAEKTKIFRLIEAAVYLDIVPLEKLAGAKIASKVRLMSVKQIRQYFGIVNDFTPEEEAAIEKEERWTEATFYNVEEEKKEEEKKE